MATAPSIPMDRGRFLVGTPFSPSNTSLLPPYTKDPRQNTGGDGNSEYERPDRFYVDKNARKTANSTIFQKSTLCRTQNLSGLWPQLGLLQAEKRPLPAGAVCDIIVPYGRQCRCCQTMNATPADRAQRRLRASAGNQPGRGPTTAATDLYPTWSCPWFVPEGSCDYANC
jgi:hypothetical protein